MSVTDDLNALLVKLNIREPVVIVGHSIGGFYATLFTDRFPEKVAGLVLIEPGFAGQFGPADPEQRRRELEAIKVGGQGLKRCADLARQGSLSPAARQGCFGLPLDLSAEETAYVTQMLTRPQWYEAEANQSDNYLPSGSAAESTSWTQERLARRDFGDLPLVVLTAQTSPREPVQDDKAYAEASQRWKAGHRALARRSTHGTWIEIPSSRHFIQLDQPQKVLDAIASVVAEVKLRSAH